MFFVDLYVLYSCDTFIIEQKYCINHQFIELYHDPTDSFERKVQRKLRKVKNKTSIKYLFESITNRFLIQQIIPNSKNS